MKELVRFVRDNTEPRWISIAGCVKLLCERCTYSSFPLGQLDHPGDFHEA